MTASSNSKVSSNASDKGGSSGKISAADSRKVTKPLMEKRRRARINCSLNELKRILFETSGPVKKEGPKQTKLEKADILEMTVSFLQNVKKSEEQKFFEGFEECLTETTRFLEETNTSPSIMDTLTEHMKSFQQNFQSSPMLFKQVTGDGIVPLVLQNGTSNMSVESSKGLVKSSSQEDRNSASQSSTSSTSTSFTLNVPSLKTDYIPISTSATEPQRKSQSLTPISNPCTSPTFSNDSNNNNSNFVPDVNAYHSYRITPPSTVEKGYHPNYHSPHHSRPQSDHSTDGFEKGKLGCNSTNNVPYAYHKQEEEGTAYALNLSIHHQNTSKRKDNSSVLYLQQRDEGPVGDDDDASMDDYSTAEPVDYSKPLNLSNHRHHDPLGDGMDDDMWRPW